MSISSERNSLTGATEYRLRLHNFYMKYNPSKVPLIDKHLQSYKGCEENLFAILAAKYGPEPEIKTPDLEKKVPEALNAPETRQVETERHYSGKRSEYPKIVSPQDGNTDFETPYWASGSLITDQDLLQLLCTRQTQNPELQKCYIGAYPHHPGSSWNGLTYICSSGNDIAPPETQFLGHVWTGTLNCEKTMYYDKVKCKRISLYCTERCQKEGNHERWRLSVYLTGTKDTSYLVRTVWDPVIVPEPLPMSQSNLSARDFYSSEAIPTRLSSQSSDGIVQPIRPQLQGDVALLVRKLLEETEEKIMLRLNILESRISALERSNDRQ